MTICPYGQGPVLHACRIRLTLIAHRVHAWPQIVNLTCVTIPEGKSCTPPHMSWHTCCASDSCPCSLCACCQIVVLCDMDKEEMEDMIERHHIDQRGSSIICRTGDPLRAAELIKVSAGYAK